MHLIAAKMVPYLLVLAIIRVGTVTYGQECIYKADVAVVIDLSEEHKDLWTKTRIFIKDLLDDLQINPNRTRVGALSSAPSANVRFYLNESSLGNAKYQIDSVGRPSGYGDIGETFELLQDDFFRQSKGDRELTPNVVVILTDGTSFDRTNYNIYDYERNLVIERSAINPTTRINLPTKMATTKPTLPPDLTESSSTTYNPNMTSIDATSPNSSATSNDPTSSVTTGSTQITTVTSSTRTRSEEDTTKPTLAQKAAKNITLHERQTRFIIYVTENSTSQMEKLASSESNIFSSDNVTKLVNGIRENSLIDCLIGSTKQPTTAGVPMVCGNLACYGIDACKRSNGNANIATCECEGKLMTKYCPMATEQYGTDMDRTCKANSAGKIQSNDARCASYISMLCPTYGPETGGTDVFIWGESFPTSSRPNVTFLPYFECDVAFYNETLIQCKTRHVANFNIRHSLLPLRITSADGGCQATLPSAFHYRPRPQIENIRPLKISPGGGQVLTIIGQYLDSDVSPRLEVTVSNGAKRSMFASICTVRSNTVLYCESPFMDLSDFTNSNQRKRRSLENSSFSMGLSYEGYNNFSESLPGLGKIEVVKDPMIKHFEEEKEIKTFKPAWPNNEKLLTIKGEYLLQAFEATDYAVRVGEGYCIITNVSSVKIVCVPPIKPPEKTDENSPHPEVVVFHGATKSSVGHLRYELSPWSNTGFRVGVSIAIVACILLIIGAIICLVCAIKRQPKAKKPLITDERKNIYLVGEYLDPNVDLRLALDASLENKLSGITIPKESVQIDDYIQTGSQGMICNGWMLDAQENQTKELTIKGFREKGAPFMHIERFLEAAVNLRNCNHKNVMQVLGIVTDKNLPRSVYAHMEYGDLKQHLCDLKDKVLRIDFKEMLHYCEDAAAGLAFIHDKGIVHEDIAARNCWVDKQHVVKICDAALTSDIYEEEYYLPGEKLRPLPIRWMAPESMVHKLYTFKSDVWSFGVLLWEIMSLGEMPFLAIPDWKIQDHVEKGNKMNKPDLSTVAMYALMTRCWTKDHKKRPSMQEITTEMESFVQGEFMNPTLARPPKGKKGGLSVLTTPVVSTDTEYKGKFIKNSVHHDNRAFVPDNPDEPRTISDDVAVDDKISDNISDIIDEGMAKQEDYEAEYDYLTPDLIRMNGTEVKNGILPEVAIDFAEPQQKDFAVENKTYDVNSANLYINNEAIGSDAVSVQVDNDVQSEAEGATYDDIPQHKDNAEYGYLGSVSSINAINTDGHDEHGEMDGAHGNHIPDNQSHNSSIHGNDSIRSGNSILRNDKVPQNGSISSRSEAALLTGIRASFLEADGYTMESHLSDASVLY